MPESLVCHSKHCPHLFDGSMIQYEFITPHPLESNFCLRYQMNFNFVGVGCSMKNVGFNSTAQHVNAQHSSCSAQDINMVCSANLNATEGLVKPVFRCILENWVQFGPK